MLEADYFQDMMKTKIADGYATQVIDVRDTVSQPQHMSDMEGAEQWADKRIEDMMSAGDAPKDVLQSDANLDLSSILVSNEVSPETRQKVERAFGLVATGLTSIKVKTEESPIQVFPAVAIPAVND
eukprot:TRINITY_DN22732_c0_g1_i1.p2 TRINITY_DN22732_c0_g1~~TRINITY_DN22732_c0_g1_i1.p2  ORF type:complete len:126 (-),score=20.25 TRINITY_DN22732_c0_g1_i1:287-664(-)